jgi:autotransporter translocation and assembly factor TamB
VRDLTASAHFAADEVRVPDLRARVGGQPLEAELRLARLADPLLDARLRGDLELSAIGPLLAGAGAKLAGRAQVDVSAHGPVRDPAAMAVAGTTLLRDVAVESPALPKRLERINGALAFSQQRVTVNGFTLAAGRSSLRLDARVDRPLALLAAPGGPGTTPAAPPAARPSAPAQVDFTLESPYLDLAELLQPGGGPVPAFNARGGGRVHVGRLLQGKLDASDVRAQVELEPGVLRVARYSLDAYGGRVQGEAEFDGRDPARPGYRAVAQLDSLQADALLSAWTPARSLLRGTIAGRMELGGQGMTPEDVRHTLTAVGLMGVLAGRLGPAKALEELARFTRLPQLGELDFRDLRVPFRIERGRFYADDVVLSGPRGDWRMAGTIGFDGSLDYALSGTLPAEVSARLPKAAALAAGALSDPQGRLILDLSLTGNVKSPRLAWNPAAMQARVAGRLTDALAEQRSKVEQQARAAQDSARAAAAAYQQALLDSARAAAARAQGGLQDTLSGMGRKLLRGLLGGAKPDTAR